MKVVISQAAEADLDAIESWIARDNLSAAGRVHGRLARACQELKDLPARFPKDAATGPRRRSVGNFVIFCRVTDHVEIARVLRGARDLGALLGEAP